MWSNLPSAAIAARRTRTRPSASSASPCGDFASSSTTGARLSGSRFHLDRASRSSTACRTYGDASLRSACISASIAASVGTFSSFAPLSPSVPISTKSACVRHTGSFSCRAARVQACSPMRWGCTFTSATPSWFQFTHCGAAGSSNRAVTCGLSTRIVSAFANDVAPSRPKTTGSLKTKWPFSPSWFGFWVIVTCTAPPSQRVCAVTTG